MLTMSLPSQGVNMLRPVSYTHLDVYKRQTCRRLLDLRAYRANPNYTLRSRNKTHGNDISNNNV